MKKDNVTYEELLAILEDEEFYIPVNDRNIFKDFPNPFKNKSKQEKSAGKVIYLSDYR